jgi:hypothetical protein
MVQAIIKDKLEVCLFNFPLILEEGLEIVENEAFCSEIRALILGGLVYFIIPEDIIPDKEGVKGALDDFFIYIFTVELAEEFSLLVDNYLQESKNRHLWIEILEFLKHIESYYP